jgi:hypothetical protein
MSFCLARLSSTETWQFRVTKCGAPRDAQDRINVRCCQDNCGREGSASRRIWLTREMKEIDD